ncbi:hypothetical protein [Sphingomonas abaci]|uniref:Tip attachment protein J domain-containing protein n=1 Tax=Sphingomonas abaci TaxID=237611 RepID=A0A7W7AH20_9SPHN|nr:hypothetical protein [Sphingomonas abaci]MBB4616899.1 hypothetical protein [Sphingomonas abaci]
MGKTVASILRVSAFAGLAAVTGGVALGVAGGFSVAASFGGVASVLGVSTGTLAIATATTAAQLFAGTPKAPRAETASQPLKTERPPRVSAYGRLKLYGAYTLYETAKDGTAVDVWAFHDGRIDGIEAWYLGDKKVTRLANGYVQGEADGLYGDSNIIQIGANLGAATETAHALVIAKVPEVWTSAHRGDGVVTGYMLSAAVKQKNFSATYANGGPNNTPLGLVIRAQPVFDWRDPAQRVDDPLTWRWSENAVLHLAHYQLVRNGKTWARHFAPTLSYWTAAANDADVAMPLRDGGTEPRYRSCVSHRHAGDGSEHKAVIAALLACFDGWMCPREDGALVVYSGRYYEPRVTVGPDIITAYTDEDGIEDENAVNEIGLTYISADHDFNAVDTTPWADEADILARGAVRSEDLANQVPSHSQARRLGKRRMMQTMAPKRGTFTTLAAGSAILSERYVNLIAAEMLGTEDEIVAYSGPAEITGLSRDLQSGAIQASWIAATPDIDEWDPAREEGEPAPTGDTIAREPLDMPVIISATAQYSAVGQTPEGDEPVDPTPGQTATGARVLIAATGPDRDDLTWSARWRVGTSGSWNEREYADADPGPGVSFLTEFVPLSNQINVQVAYSVGDGRLSPWSASAVVDTTTG